MSLLRQGRHFILIGIAQWLVDWGMLVVLSRAGVPIAIANVAGRISGAVLGFWLNGNITFARDGGGPGWRQFARYATWWCTTTVLSTSAVSAIDVTWGLHGAWLGKPLVDALLSIGSFFISRHWVYR